MSLMKILQTFFLSAATTVLLAACNSPVPPVVIEPPVVVEQTAFNLGITVSGAAGASVRVLNAAGEIKFNDTVTGSKTLSALPKGKYTVTGGAVANFTAPAVQTADLSAGNGSVTLTYMATAGQALALDKIQGVLSDPLAPGNTLNVFFGNSVLASSKVGADGSVSLSLAAPPPASLNPFLPPAGSSCSYTGALNAGKVFVTDNVILNGSQGDAIGAVTERPVGGSSTASVLHAYADIAQNDQGTIACPGSSPIKVDVRLLPGWNVLIVDKDAGGTVAVVTAPPDIRVQLELNKFPANVRIVLDAPSLTLKAGESVTVTATIFQRGGLSGKIDLSTDVPGVSVEPTSVTLPVLGTQNVRGQSLFDSLALISHGLDPLKVGTQRLNTLLTFKAAADAKEFTGTMTLLARQNSQVVGQVGLELRLVAPSVTASVTSGINLDRGQSTTLQVSIYATGLLKGPVQIALEGLPLGVTATSASVSFAGASQFEQASAQLSVSASATAAPGQTTAQLVMTAGSLISRSPVYVLVQTPVVNISFPGLYGYPPAIAGYQGSTTALPVRVQSAHGFTGTTTLTLTKLPNGVSALPLTVTLSPDVSVNASFQLQIASDAPFGAFPVTVAGDVLAPDGNAQLSLSISPERFLTPNVDLNVLPLTAPAKDGFWVAGESKYTNGNSVRTLALVQNKQVTLSRDVPDTGGVVGILSNVNGDAYVVSLLTVTGVSTLGVVTTIPIQKGPTANSLVLDKQNKIWSVEYDSVTRSHQLSKFSTETGTFERLYGFGDNYSNIPVYVDDSGSNVYVVDTKIFKIIKISTTTGAKTEIAIPSGVLVESLAISDAGEVWGTQSTGGVFKLNADGTASVFDTLPVGGRAFFDKVAPGVLWIAPGYYSGTTAVYKYNTATQARNVIPFSVSVRAVLPDLMGGATAFLYSDSSSPSYYSVLK